MKKQLEIIKDEKLRALAADFVKTQFDLEIMTQSTESIDNAYDAYQESIEQSMRHPFWVHVNNLEEFKNAKKAFFEKAFLREPVINKLQVQYIFLELCCANALIHVCNPKLIKQATVSQKKIDSVRQAAKQLKNKLRIHDGFYFESTAKQHVLRAILSDLLSSKKESPCNTGKLHNLMMREAFAKYLLTQLLSYCDGLELSPTFFADRVISIAGAFFAPTLAEMDRSDWIAHAQTLDLYWRAEQEFLNKTLSQYMNDFFAKEP